jgi:hypothetical protein
MLLQEIPKDLVKIPIVNLIKFADTFAGIEVHLPVGPKFVKLNYGTDQFIDILRKLQQKEVTEVYVHMEDCRKILSHVQESLSAKNFYDPKTVVEEKVETVDHAMAVVKNVINQIGVSVETVKLLKDINTRSMTLLSESPSIFAFVKRFRKSCSEQFLNTMLTSYVLSLIIDQFDWKSDQVKEKGAMASLMCDVLLEKEDFKTLLEWNGNLKDLPERIRRHPLEMADKLRNKRNLIPTEIITIIEQHHELPNGTGFPLGITGSRFNSLSCIFIVSQQFVEKLTRSSFDFEQRHEIICDIQKTYDSKNFEKALEGLIKVVG